MYPVTRRKPCMDLRVGVHASVRVFCKTICPCAPKNERALDFARDYIDEENRWKER